MSMSKTIFIADDSLTIQKVVSITLASHSYQLVACHSEEELFLELGKQQCDLLLLDFNLSEDHSIEELVSKSMKLSCVIEDSIMFLSNDDLRIGIDVVVRS